MRLLQGSELKKDLTTRPLFNLEKVMSTFKGYIKLEYEERKFSTLEGKGRDKKKKRVMKGSVEIRAQIETSDFVIEVIRM